MNEVLGRFRCWLGRHDWRLQLPADFAARKPVTESGFICLGNYQCSRCGAWKTQGGVYV